MITFQKLIATFKQNQKYQIVVFIALLFLSWFYWFQLRPSNIRINCHNLAMDKANKIFERVLHIYEQAQVLNQAGRTKEAQAIVDKLSDKDYEVYESISANRALYYQDDYEDYYGNCLHEEGLK